MSGRLGRFVCQSAFLFTVVEKASSIPLGRMLCLWLWSVDFDNFLKNKALLILVKVSPICEKTWKDRRQQTLSNFYPQGFPQNLWRTFQQVKMKLVST